MPRSISEADWKIFREIHPIALERFCSKRLDEIAELKAESDQTNLQRYQGIKLLIEQSHRQITDAFPDLRRSTALW